MKKVKNLALILVIIVLAQIFAACANNETPVQTTSSDSDAATDVTAAGESSKPEETTNIGFAVSDKTEDIPDDANFNGKDFIIMVGDPNEKVWTYTNMVVEEETGDTIDDAYYKRNRLIENKLNINIKQRDVALGNAQQEFKREVESGAGGFDISLMSYNDAARLAMNNYCIPLNEVPYVDLDKPWWDQGSRRDLSIANYNFLMASDISIGDNDNTWLIYFDKQYVKDHGLETPYNLVNEGKWTFDKMLEMMKAVASDVDGDTKMTLDDRYGMLTHGENYAGMWIAANQTLITKNSADMPEVTFGNETFVNIWHKIIEIMNDESCRNDNIEFISTGLANGQTLFGTEILKFVRNYRENEREFGIIPMPKFDEQQESYHTYVAVSAPLLIIPNSCPNWETVGIIVEAMAAEGHRTIMPAYYNVSIEGKFVRDEESIDMLNIAFATRKYDLGVVFDWGSVASQLKDAGNKNDGNIASLLEKRSAAIQNAMDKTFAAFEER